MDINVFKDIIHNSPCAFVCHKIIYNDDDSVDYEFLELNNKFNEIMDINDENLKGKKLSEFSESIGKMYHWSKIYETINIKNIPEKIEYYNVKNNRWYRVDISLLNGEYLISFFSDITSYKETEIEIFNRKQLFELAVKGTNDGIWDWNIETNELYLSTRLKEQLGYEKEELENSMEVFKESIFEEDREKVMNELEAYLSGSVETYNITFRMVSKDGEIKWINSRGEALFDSNNRAFRMVGAHTDITKQKLFEDELLKEHSLFSQGPVFTITWGPENGWPVRYVSENVTKILGYTPEEMKAGIFSYVDLIHPDDLERIGKEVNYYMSNDINFYEQSYRLKMKENEYRWFYDFTMIIRDKQNEVNEIRGYLFDQTHIKEMENKLLVAKLKAEEANRAKSDFLTNISHEIRTPLNSIIGFSDLLKKTELNEVQKEYIDNVFTSSISLLEIINDILDFSKIESGKFELNTTKCNVNTLLNETLQITTYIALKKNLEVLLDIDENVPDYFYVDIGRVKQILINILNNAVKFTEKGEVELKLSFKNVEKDRGEFCFEIIDTGIGISKEDQKKLFSAFSQADTSSTRVFGGVGLGLTISNFLAEKMEGKLDFTSEIGQGSTFSFRFKTEYEYEENNEILNNQNIKKVLLIDNSERALEIASKLFDRMDISAYTFDNGLEAMALIKENNDVDMVFIDYDMPYLNGLNILNIMKENFYDFFISKPIVLLTASQKNRNDFINYFEDKKLMVLTKPMQKNHIIDCLNNLMEVEEEANASTAHKDKEEVVVSADSKKILIAEDSNLNMKFINIIFREILPNSNLICAKDGVEALEKFKEEENIDMVVMDIQMPRMDGVEATRLIREYEKQKGNIYTPIIALTADITKGNKENCYKNGMDDFMPKPVEREKFVNMVHKYLIDGAELVKENNIDEEHKHFNKQSFMNRIDYEQELFDELIADSLPMIEDYIENIRKSIENFDIDAVNKGAHKLKGISLNMSFEQLADCAGELMNVELNHKEAEDFLKNIYAEFDMVKRNIKIERRISNENIDSRG